MEEIKLEDLIPIVIALAAIISPVFVAFVNNRHQIKLKKAEYQHELEMRELELKGEISKQNYEKYYTDKKNAYDNLLRVAGEYTPPNDSYSYLDIDGLSSAAASAILFSSTYTKNEIRNFVSKANTVSAISNQPKEAYWGYLSDLAMTLNDELKSCDGINGED